MKVLIVDDNPAVVRGIEDHCTDKAWTCKVISFDQFDENLNAFEPDAIVLDWKDDASNTNKGGDLLEKIWATGFKPIIIFSGYADVITLEEKYQSSNLVKVQAKGDEEPVIKYLDMIVNFVPVITGLKNEFNDALITALNSISMLQCAQPVTENIMRYVFAKRVSNYFDKECEGELPPAWIQYTYPPIASTLYVGDIIRSIPASGDITKIGVPEEYKIVLTPSCDLAHGNAPAVLCANCYEKKAFYVNDMDYQAIADGSKERFISSKINTGYNNRLIALPQLPNILPYMTVNLKKTLHLSFDQIAINPASIIPGVHKFCRIASMDSPYREQVVWAHMISSCRPGVPDRDVEQWVKEITR